MIPAHAYPFPPYLLNQEITAPLLTVFKGQKTKARQPDFITWLPVWKTDLSYVKREGELLIRWVRYADLPILSQTTENRELIRDFQELIGKDIPKILKKVNWLESELCPENDGHLKVDLLKPVQFRHIHQQIATMTGRYKQLKILLLEKLVEAYPVRIV